MLVLGDSELAPLVMSSESSAVPCHAQIPGRYHDFPQSPQLPTSSPQHLQHGGCPAPGPHHQHEQSSHHHWDINDCALPLPDTHDSFELWPSGHCRRVYRGDSDDARRHVSGWAMRNTNNHNALILKKSCLGVLLCSADCMLDTGKKVHLRPAICDKARRKQIGKPCPNPGCSGKLQLLACRGHCGYPVTHFWRHVNSSVYFQAKGYHDHPRPEVKSLSEKGRHAFSKQLRQDGDRVISMTLKRRFPILTTDDLPERKIFLHSQDEVLCSCPPFECVCPKTLTHTAVVHPTLGFLKDTPPHPFLSHRSPSGGGAPMEQLPPAPFTQINITNTCMPPTSLDVNIPGFDFYKNCPKFGYHPHHHENELKMYSFSGRDESGSAAPQYTGKSAVSDYRQSQVFASSNPPAPHPSCVSPRPFSNCSYVTSYDTDPNRYRLYSQHYSRSPSVESSSPGHFRNVKSEPCDAFMSNSPSPSRPTHQDPAYNPMSPSYHRHQESSPRLVDCHSKFEHSVHEYSKEQGEHERQEPTYITLTSPQRPAEDAQDRREYNSCRMSHSNRSPTTMSLDPVIYPPHPSQPTRVESCITPPLSAPQQRAPNHPANSPAGRRSPGGAPLRLMNAGEPLSTAGIPARSNAIPPSYAPLSTHCDTSLTPLSHNSEACVSPYPASGAGYNSNLSTPYGYFYNDMFATPAQQAYRNRSINITLTYN